MNLIPEAIEFRKSAEVSILKREKNKLVMLKITINSIDIQDSLASLARRVRVPHGTFRTHTCASSRSVYLGRRLDSHRDKFQSYSHLKRWESYLLLR